jgi:uncharacterized protein (TIGR03435 family)
MSAILLVPFLLGVGGLIPAGAGIAQTPPDLKPLCADLPKDFCANLPKAFEVASIKDSKSDGRSSGFWVRPGRFWTIAVPVKPLILFAYEIKPEQLEGLPSWADSRRYSIQAVEPPSMADSIKLARGLPPNQRIEAFQAIHQNLFEMAQSLLAERFGMKAHWITRQLPVYDLVISKGGSKLKAENAADFNAAHHKPGSGSWFNSGDGRMTALGVSTAQLAKVLSRQVGRLVIDQTGLKGKYDFKMTWGARADRLNARNIMSKNSNSSGPAPTNFSGPSIFTALQEQLGLKLKSAKGPVQVLVVDHIEPPTPN